MVFADGFKNPEGPVALPDGTWLIVEGGADRGCVTHISADGQTKRIIRKTGRPNGLAVDSDGVIYVAESKTPSLLRLTMDGKADANSSILTSHELAARLARVLWDGVPDPALLDAADKGLRPTLVTSAGHAVEIDAPEEASA